MINWNVKLMNRRPPETFNGEQQLNLYKKKKRKENRHFDEKYDFHAEAEL